MDIVLQTGKPASLRISSQVDKLDLPTHEFRPSKELGDHENCIAHSVRLRAGITAHVKRLHEPASNYVRKPTLQVVSGAGQRLTIPTRRVLRLGPPIRFRFEQSKLSRQTSNPHLAEDGDTRSHEGHRR
jgi:hypothetical protein